MSNELIVIEPKNVMSVFTNETGLNDIMNQIEMEIASFEHDLSTAAGRKRTASLAYKVAQTKTYLDGLGKELVSDWKSKAKIVDVNRKSMRDRLDELKEEARKPLTEWEEDQAKIEAEKKAAEEAEALRKQVEADHEIALLLNEKFDREAEELRKAEEEAERQRKEAEEKARVERERLASIEREKELERQRVEAEQKAKRDAEEAAERARQEEIARQKAEQDRLQREQEQREANRRHVGAIRKAAKESLMALGLGEQQAKDIVMAINDGKIANVSIKY